MAIARRIGLKVDPRLAVGQRTFRSVVRVSPSQSPALNLNCIIMQVSCQDAL